MVSLFAQKGQAAVHAGLQELKPGAGTKPPNGAIVVTSTRTGSGRIAARRGPVPGRFGSRELSEEERQSFASRVAAEDLGPVRARVLLMLALTRTQDPNEIQRMFTEY